MRRARRPLLLLILLVGGIVSAAPVSLIAWRLLRALSTTPGRWSGAAVVGAVLVLDVLFHRFGRPRPLAVNRQVPRHWGHDLGPWWAAARYAPRLGVGPATILTSWAWWGMLVSGGLAGWWWSITASVVFVCARSVLTIAVAWDVDDGQAMARRLAGVQSVERHAVRGSDVVLLLGVLSALAWGPR